MFLSDFTRWAPRKCFFSLISLLIIVSFWSKSSRAISPLLGVSPQEEKYFSAKIIPCKDGTKTFPRDRLNDGFCDCIDGTDEPGTSACPSSKFYCKNAGSISQILFSSRVNDQICDCCDGSDEYDGTITCPNTCSGDGILQNENAKYNSVEINFNANIVQKTMKCPRKM